MYEEVAEDKIFTEQSKTNFFLNIQRNMLFY